MANILVEEKILQNRKIVPSDIYIDIISLDSIETLSKNETGHHGPFISILYRYSVPIHGVKM